METDKPEAITIYSKIQEAQQKRTLKQHPFLVFGRAITNWLKLLETLICVFGVFSIIGITQIVLFQK